MVRYVNAMQEGVNRTFSGRFNNLHHTEWGRAGEQLLRIVPPAYVMGSGPSGPNRPNPREISNVVCAGPGKPSSDKLTHFIWAWGQFLDHELDLTPDSGASDDMKAPKDDPHRPGARIPFHRSLHDPSTGGGTGNPRQQLNQLSAYIDGANVYGVDETRAAILRRNDGSGKLKTSRPSRGAREKGDLLPLNDAGAPNVTMPPPRPNFLAGDIRANEHAVLTCMHTLWVREHNYWCDKLAKARAFVKKLKDLSPGQRDEIYFQRARKIVGAEMQAITYREFLPALLGRDAIGPYTGYKPNVNAGISNIFSTACYRLGHSMLPSEIPVVEGRKRTTIPLRDLFFVPGRVEKIGLDAIFQGLASDLMQEIDNVTVEDVRSFLFNHGKGNAGELLDLAALNIQRGRDHGLADFNTCRVALGLRRHASFSSISKDKDVRARLEKAYGNVDNIDPWVGGICEDHVRGAAVGEFIHAVLSDQFERLRDGDRFWYENDPELSQADRRAIAGTRLSTVIKRNTGIKTISANVFKKA